MTLIDDETTCALCDDPVKGDDMICTSGAWEGAGDLEPFCDAAMHRACFNRWPEAERFARSSFAATSARERFRLGPWLSVHATAEVLITVRAHGDLGGDDRDGEIMIYTAWPMASWRLPLAAWDQQHDAPTSTTALEAGADRDGDAHLAALWPALRERLPDEVSLMTVMAPRLALRVAFHGEVREQQARQREAMQQQARELERQLREMGFACSVCGLHSRDHTFCADPDGKRTSYIVCTACHRSTIYLMQCSA